MARPGNNKFTNGPVGHKAATGADLADSLKFLLMPGKNLVRLSHLLDPVERDSFAIKTSS